MLSKESKPWEGAPYAGESEEEGRYCPFGAPGAEPKLEPRAGAANVGKDLGEQFSGATKPGETRGRGPSRSSPARTLWNRCPVPDASELDPRQGPPRGPVSREPRVYDHHPTNTPHLPSRVSSPEPGSQELREDLENQTRGQKAETMRWIWNWASRLAIGFQWTPEAMRCAREKPSRRTNGLTLKRTEAGLTVLSLPVSLARRSTPDRGHPTNENATTKTTGDSKGVFLRDPGPLHLR